MSGLLSDWCLRLMGPIRPRWRSQLRVFLSGMLFEKSFSSVSAWVEMKSRQFAGGSWLLGSNQRLRKALRSTVRGSGLRASPGLTVNSSSRIEPPLPRETRLLFPRTAERNVLRLCFLWVRVVAPLVSQCFLCFPVSVKTCTHRGKNEDGGLSEV